MVVSEASDVSAPDDTMDLIAAMATLGLPTSFLSRSKIQEKASKKPSISKLDASGPKEATEAEPEPSELFSVRSVQLFTKREPSPEEITLDRREGLEFYPQANEGETQFAGLESRNLELHHRRDEVELAHDGEDSSSMRGDLELEVEAGGEVASSGVMTWEPVWDEQYQRYYFCNAQTWESTWDPPLGYEHYGASPMEWSECSSVDQSQQHAHHSELICVNPSSTESRVGSCKVSDKGGMDQGLSSCEDPVEADEVQEHGASALVRDLEDVNEPDGGGRADAVDEEHDHSERQSPFSVIMGGEDEKVEGGPTCATPAKSAVVNRLEDVSYQDSAVQSSTMTEGEGQLIESLPVFPGACGVHTRFSDSDDGSTEDNREINWGGIEEQQSVPITSDGRQDETEAWSLLSESGALTTTKRRVKRRRVKRLSESEKMEKVLLPGMAEMMSRSLIKYWLQRYSLFSRYDEGIKLDEEGWFSVTPEAIAEHQALRCPMGLVIDAFTGVGGNAIQFALKSNYVIAIDIDPKRVELARHNAEIYGVTDRIEFIVGDFFLLAPSLKADFLFLSPPWGGPEYLNQEKYNIQTMLQPKDGFTLFKIAQTIAPNVALFLPRNVDLAQLQELSWLSSPPLPCEVEKNYVDHRLKAITAYYGEVAGQALEPELFIPA